MVKRAKVAALLLFIVTVGASAAGPEGIRLQFRPKIGKKQTVRITTRVATTTSQPSSAERTEVWILTLDLQPLALVADGGVAVKATFVRLQHQLLLGRKGEGAPMLDSADEKRRDSRDMALCRALVGESFTAVVSAQGRLEKVDTGSFCDAVAPQRMKYEDEAIRRDTTRVKEAVYKNKDEATRRRLIEADVEKAIRKENDRYTTAAGREYAYRQGAVDCYLYSTRRLRWLLNDVLTPFAAGPVTLGSRWTAPVMVAADGPYELGGTYILKGQEDNTCTIQVEARRTTSDRSLVAPAVEEAQRSWLAGAYLATVKVDRTTGTVLSKETSLDLTGTGLIPVPGSQTTGTGVQVTSKATTTVEVLP